MIQGVSFSTIRGGGGRIDVPSFEMRHEMKPFCMFAPWLCMHLPACVIDDSAAAHIMLQCTHRSGWGAVHVSGTPPSLHVLLCIFACVVSVLHLLVDSFE